MPSMNLDVVDAAELAELLQFLTGWITSDPARLAPSLLAFVGHPAYGLPQLSSDLDRFTFLLGGNDGEPLFQSGPLSALHPTIRPALPLQPVTRKPGRRPNTPRTNTSVHQSFTSRSLPAVSGPGSKALVNGHQFPFLAAGLRVTGARGSEPESSPVPGSRRRCRGFRLR
jgi:hypothetical protein